MYDRAKRFVSDSVDTVNGQMGNGYPEPADPASAEPEIGDVQEITPSREESNDHADAAIGEDAFTRNLMPSIPSVGGPGEFWGPQMQDYSRLGGKEVFDRAYVQAPAEARSAAKELGDLEGQRGDALAGAMADNKLNQQLAFANMRANQIANQEEFAKRNAEVQQAAQAYTQDLSDTGRFWKNPGNILSAIGAAIVAWGTPQDPSVGIKLINQQVMNDWNQRREAANQGMGELRSNLAAYRQMMGDKEAGDMLALSESYKVAAMDLQRIGAQFEGPLAKAKAKMLAADMESKAAVAQADAFMKAVNIVPRRYAPGEYKRVEEARKAFPGEAYTPITDAPGAVKPAQVAPAGNANVPGFLARDAAENGYDTGTNAPYMGGGKSAPLPVSAAISALKGRGGPDSKTAIEGDIGLDAAETRAPGVKKLLPMYQRQILDQAIIATGQRGVNNPAIVRQAAQQIINNDVKQADTAIKEAASKGVQTNLPAWRTMKTEYARVKAAMAGSGMSENDFLGHLRNASGDWADWYRRLELNYLTGTDTKEKAQRKLQLEAVANFHQMLSERKLRYYHDMLGGAMSDSELELAKGILANNSSMSQIGGFIEQGNRQANSEWSGYTKQIPPRAAEIIRIRFGLNNPSSDTKGVVKKKRSSGDDDDE
jgi:hypothetical protein